MPSTITSIVTPAVLSWVGGNKTAVLENSLDLSEVTVASGDTVQMIAVPAGTFVHKCVAKVVTADATLTDFDIGDGDTADGWVDGASAAATGWKDDVDETYSVGIGKFYTVADTIDLKANAGNAGTGLIKVVAVVSYFG